MHGVRGDPGTEREGLVHFLGVLWSLLSRHETHGVPAGRFLKDPPLAAGDFLRITRDMSKFTAYMDGIDFQHHRGQSLGGDRIYSTEEAVRRRRPCADACGVVEVEVSLVKWVHEQDLTKGAKDNRAPREQLDEWRRQREDRVRAILATAEELDDPDKVVTLLTDFMECENYVARIGGNEETSEKERKDWWDRRAKREALRQGQQG